MELVSAAKNQSVTPEFLSGGGEMGERIRNYDWGSTSLGPVETWPQNLRTCIRIMLTSRQPIWIGWGKEMIKFYNDPYKAIVGGKHPWALGKPACVVWKEIWHDIEPMLYQVMEKNEGIYAESQLLIMVRNGYPEETYYTFSYTPILGDDGKPAGMICANTDDTYRIINERQLKTLTLLGQNLTEAKTNSEVIRDTIDTLKSNMYDFPFALFYEYNEHKAVLAAATHEEIIDTGIMAPEINVGANDGLGYLLAQAIETRKMQVLNGLSEYALPMGGWQVSAEKAIILPVLQGSSKEPYGFLVVGCNPYRLLDEKYAAFFSLVTDQVATSFANIRLLEEERRRAAVLAEIDHAKTTFFSNISHEFRTPLTLLLGPIEDALEAPEAIEDNKKRLEVAYRNALRMQKLVNTLLEFSRIEAGRMEGRYINVDIGKLTEDLASTFRSAIEKAGIALHVHSSEVKDEVYVDPDMWEKIILNLVSNAFKYTQAGSISVDIKQQGQYVVIAISDTGIGIPEDQMEKIFSRFHRVENTEGRSQEGTGIGLALVKELVKLHGGNITVTSKLGEGTTFVVTLPTGKAHLPGDKIETRKPVSVGSVQVSAYVKEAARWVPEYDTNVNYRSATEQPPASPRNKILLADDNADMRDYVLRLLADHFDVLTANDGEAAFQLVIKERFDLIVSDIMMPKLDGFGLLAKIRAHSGVKNTPFIFLSARAGEEAKVEGLAAGADDYLVKPFTAKELIARVFNHIRINKVRRETEQQFVELFHQAPAIINIMKGPDHRFILFHPKNREIFEGRDFTGLTVREALPELESQAVIAMLDEVYTTGKTISQNELPVFITDKNGQPVERYFSFVYQPFFDLHGRVEGILNFALEVTENVQARRKIEETNIELENLVTERTKELQRSNQDLQQFAHVASHDLKEPVRKIKTFTSRLDDEYHEQLPERAKVFVNKIQHASDRMMAMIDGVLRYSKVDAEQQPVVEIDLDQVIANIEIDLEILIQQKGARIVREKMTPVQGAAVLIYQLFYNIVNNSLKFSKEGEPPVITITSALGSDDNFEVITVSDNGIGFDATDAEKIFESFTRLHSKDKYEGTGLGLALCKRIVERHHGTISATSEKGKGTRFTIFLPIRQHGPILL
jgi:signal transduction histidine kinase